MTFDTTTVTGHARPDVGDKVLCLGDQTLYVRGVTYGAFHPTAEGAEYHDPERVARDFAQMFAPGCAGAFVFAWTDEWYRGGQDIDDWEFGLTDRQRRPKPALAAAREAYPSGETLWHDRRDWRAGTDA